MHCEILEPAKNEGIRNAQSVTLLAGIMVHLQPLKMKLIKIYDYLASQEVNRSNSVSCLKDCRLGLGSIPVIYLHLPIMLMQCFYFLN